MSVHALVSKTDQYSTMSYSVIVKTTTLAGGRHTKVEARQRVFPDEGPKPSRAYLPGCHVTSQPPQVRTTPQSICTKFDREYFPTPPPLQAAAAFAIWLTDLVDRRRSAACPCMCSEFLATPRLFERNMALVWGLR